MVRMINATFGNEMCVADTRVEEYKAAGHVLAANAEKPAEPEEEPEKPKKARAKKREA